MKITDVLITEHALFNRVFAQVERALSQCGAVKEVQMLAGLVEGLLRHHGETEAHLAYVALDHALKEKGKLDRLHEEHQEIDRHFEQVRSASDLETARRLLHTALQSSRDHFRYEERHLFPLLEQVLQPEALSKLGHASLQDYVSPPKDAKAAMPRAA